MTGPVLDVFLIAGESSGDALAATLMAALRRRRPEVTFRGVGGPLMEAEGLRSLFPMSDIAVMGVQAVAGRLPLLLKRLREASDAAIAEPPDVLVIVDAPDFTHRVARRVRRRLPRVPIVDYVAPTVWAWRPGRARKMRPYVDALMAILPFEPAALARLGGPPCTYVGHPLVEHLGALRGGGADAAAGGPPLLLALPGSRRGEIRRLMPVFGEAFATLRDVAGPFELVLPTLPHVEAEVRVQARSWRTPPRIVLEPAEKWAAFRRARAALAASGTVTLELALAQVPTVAAYKVSALEEAVARTFVRLPFYTLPNLVTGTRVIPELLQAAATPAQLCAALAPLLHDSPERRAQLAGFARLDALMQVEGGTPSDRAAEVVLSAVARAP